MGSLSISAAVPETVDVGVRRVCTRCVMDTSDPDIRFDSAGVCHHCHEYERLTKETVVGGEAGRVQLERLADRIKRDGAGKTYDCVIGVSGGVDSTYVAYRVKQLGLRPLALHLDNGWDSEIAASNIAVTLKHLGIDLETFVIDWEEFKDIQLAFLRSGVPDCEIPSDHAIVASVYNLARRRGIRHTIWGYNTRTETHLPPSWSQGHYDWGYIRAIHRQFGSGRIRTFPHLNFIGHVAGLHLGPSRTNLLDFIDYSKQDALTFLKAELGWRSYGGKHHESVYTRWYQGWFLPTRFGFDKRRSHLSSLICSRQLSREHALRELENPPYDVELQRADTEYVVKKFGLAPQEFEAIMAAPKRSFHEFPSHSKLRQGTAFQGALRAYQFAKYGVLRYRRTGD
jgi:N-acetyl sugar amidotransferase